jgi:6-phospho-3-hexuloisomerase
MSDRDSVKVAGEDLLRRVGAVMAEVNWVDLLDLADMLPRVHRTYLTGAGRSGLVARSFGMRLMHAGLEAFVPGETMTPAADKDDLLVAISCTGKSGITQYIARRARNLGAQVVVLTAEADSLLTREANKVVLIPARDENIVLRAAVFEHAASLSLDAVFNVLSTRLKLDMDAYRQRHANLE